MLRSFSVPVFLLPFSSVPAAAQTTDPSSSRSASQTQNPPISTDAKKPKKVLTNEDLSNSTGRISVVGNGQNNPGGATPKTPNPQYVGSVRNQLEKLLKQIVDVDKQIADLKNFKAGEPSTNSSGVQLDRRYEREPVEVQIRALQDKRKDLQGKVDALYERAKRELIPASFPERV